MTQEPSPARRDAGAPPVVAREERHVVVACDTFKGSLTAEQVRDCVVAGLEAHAGVPVRSVMVADGGDGTLEAALAAGFERIPVMCTGPTGERVHSAYAIGRVDGRKVALIEMADACGLPRLPQGRLDPMGASSRGVGEVLAVALDEGARDIVLGVGGSASTDGGAGMLQALGARLFDEDGTELRSGGGELARLATLDLSDMHPGLDEARIVLATDVTNPLLGAQGCVAVFAPQKGAGDEELEDLESALENWARHVTDHMGRDDTGLPGAGAAGGVGYAAQAVLGARMERGVDIMLRLARFDRLLEDAALVVTGEGSLDAQTALGKTPAGVAAAARRAGVPCVAVCGRSTLDPDAARELGIEQVYALTDLEPDPQRCMREAAPLLRELAARVAADRL